MRLNNFFKALLASMLVAASPAQADITRGCTASLDVFVVDKKPNPFLSLATIEARAGCKNKLHADDCRERARKQLDVCLAAIWAGRNANAIPAACQNLISGSGRPGAKLQYDGIYVIDEPQRLTARGAHAVCCQMRPKADRVDVSFSGRITGDRKCGSGKTGKNMYQDEYGFQLYDMKCTEWRAKGICG